MCGIVAIYAYGEGAPPVDEREVTLIRDAMTPRGPDAAGSWVALDRRIGLGNRRLSILDLSRTADQPMLLEGSGTRITYNGEIYNHRELRRELEAQGRVFRTTGDTEVLLQAYDAFGPEMVQRLRGMYAFAIWDERRRGLFLARDPFGIKPLYYSDDGRTITIASAVKALRASPRIAATPGAAGQVSFLLWGFIVEPHTLFREIRALPAGATLWIDGEGARRPAPFWSAGQVFRAAEARAREPHPARPRPAAIREALRDALAETVRYHMIADVPVGAFLSGGLDSGTLVALAAESAGGDLQTLTLGFDALRGTAADEVPFAETAARACGLPHRVEWIGRQDFVRESARLIELMDQPTIDSVNVFFVSAMAARAGLKVALSGLGGDELFGGYPSFRTVPRLVHRLAPFRLSPGFARGFRKVTAPLLRRLTSPKYAGLLELSGDIAEAYLLRRGLFMPWEIPAILGPDLAAAGWAELAPLARLREETQGMADEHAAIATLEMSIYMRNQLLRDSDWAGMAHSVEIRTPLVDSALLERLAPLLMGPTALGKADMVGVLRRPLPAALLARAKSGFTVPIRQWLIKSRMIEARTAERGLRSWARYLLESHLRAGRGPASVPANEPQPSLV